MLIFVWFLLFSDVGFYSSRLQDTFSRTNKFRSQTTTNILNDHFLSLFLMSCFQVKYFSTALAVLVKEASWFITDGIFRTISKCYWAFYFWYLFLQLKIGNVEGKEPAECTLDQRHTSPGKKFGAVSHLVKFDCHEFLNTVKWTIQYKTLSNAILRLIENSTGSSHTSAPNNNIFAVEFVVDSFDDRAQLLMLILPKTDDSISVVDLKVIIRSNFGPLKLNTGDIEPEWN